MGMVGIKKGKYEWDKEEKVRNEIRKDRQRMGSEKRRWEWNLERRGWEWDNQGREGRRRKKKGLQRGEGGRVEVYRSFVSAFIQ